MVEVMKIMATSFKRSHAGPATLSALNPHLRERLLDAYGQFWVSLLWGHCFFLLAPGVHKILFVPSKSLFTQSSVSSGGFGGVNGNLLQEVLCYARVYCTQSPCPCSSPLLTDTSTVDIQTQLCLSLCGISGSWCAQGLFEPSEHL